MAAGNNSEQQSPIRRIKLSHALLTCFCAPARLPPTGHVTNGAEEGRSRSTGVLSSSTVVDEKPLRKIADSFRELANVVVSEDSVVDLAAFARACSFVSSLFGCIGFHFNFIKMDYVTKVNDLKEASKSFQTLESMVDEDVRTNTVRKQGSHSRNLLKIKRGLDFLRVLYEQILLTEENSVRDAVVKAYTQIFQSQHSWALRKAVSARVHYVPSKQQLYRKLNEDETSARVLLQAYVTASPPLLQYIDNIFLSRNLGIDW